MLQSEKLAIAAHLHVVMRRKTGRVTDVEWLVRSPDYAREIIGLALAETHHPDLIEWAQRLHAACFPTASEGKGLAGRAAAGGHDAAEVNGKRPARDTPRGQGAALLPASGRYVGSLR
jgi:hypothetical protein